MAEDREVSRDEILKELPNKADPTLFSLSFAVWFGLLIALLGSLVALNSSYFTIRQVVVEGNYTVTAEAIILASRITRHQNLLTLNLPKTIAAIERLPYIASAKIIKHFPNRLVIKVRERKPICLLKQGKFYYVLGNDFTMMGIAATKSNAWLPVVTGVPISKARNRFPLTKAQVEVVRELIKLASRKNHWKVCRIDLNRSLLVMEIPGNQRPVTVLLGDSSRIKEKVTQIQAVLAGNRFGEIISIDLRLPGISTITTSN